MAKPAADPARTLREIRGFLSQVRDSARASSRRGPAMGLGPRVTRLTGLVGYLEDQLRSIDRLVAGGLDLPPLLAGEPSAIPKRTT